MTDSGERLAQEDDAWQVTDVSDSAVTISNPRTDHIWPLGLDNVREFRTPDFLLLRCQLTLRGQQVLSEPIIITSVDRNTSGFETLLNHSWVREFIGTQEVWISEVDNMFQVELGEKADEFKEEWTQKFPDKNNSYTFPVLLRVQGVEIKELKFVSCDGGRIIVPMPEIMMDGKNRRFEYDRNSIRYKVGQIVGQFYIYETLEGVARYAGIRVR